MPALFGLDALVLVLAAASTPHAVADTNSIYRLQDEGVTAVAIVPDCPSGFSVKTATASVFECTRYVAAQHAAATAYIAGQTGCKYPSHWSGPTVTLTPVRDAALVRWVCTH